LPFLNIFTCAIKSVLYVGKFLNRGTESTHKKIARMFLLRRFNVDFFEKVVRLNLCLGNAFLNLNNFSKLSNVGE
jgi:hypothetical protein